MRYIVICWFLFAVAGCSAKSPTTAQEFYDLGDTATTPYEFLAAAIRGKVDGLPSKVDVSLLKIRVANGDPVAQHKLARLLFFKVPIPNAQVQAREDMVKCFKTDTSRAFSWLKRESVVHHPK